MLKYCYVCGADKFNQKDILWQDLIDAWELSPKEAEYINKQQGFFCKNCNNNLRSITLAKAILSAYGFKGVLCDFVKTAEAQRLRVLEINEAGGLTQTLEQLPLHNFISYPEYDMMKLPFEPSSYDLVIHSDTLEHIDKPVIGLAECERVLDVGGYCIFTVPIIVDRLSRDKKGTNKSYHGGSEDKFKDYVVHTEFGADAWEYVIQAGFENVTMHVTEYPSGLAISAQKKEKEMNSKTYTKNIESNGERYHPNQAGEIKLEHLHRYALACEFAQGKKVLDIASGEGYGSAMLADVAKHVTGVDIDNTSIEMAKQKYSKNNLEFKQGSCIDIPLEESSVDLVVSFETIEHLEQHEEMMAEIKRVLSQNGMLLISTPNKDFSNQIKNNNPFHLKELSRDEFDGLISEHFKNFNIYRQRIVYGSAIFSENKKSKFTYFNIEKSPNHLLHSRRKSITFPHFYIAIASDVDLPENIEGLLEESAYHTESLTTARRNRDYYYKYSQALLKSKRYRIGSIIAFPWELTRIIMKTVKR
jgi:ubiquinone/menaquinone biosynthesis C-methylase UbiE